MEHRYDFVYLFEVIDGNPNGDPDAGNLPRVDPETGQGLVTDVCLKRKIRNFVALKHDGTNGDGQGYQIYVKEKAVLNQQHELAYKDAGLKPDKKLPKKEADAKKLTAFMCANFFDIRAFGAVMTTGVNCGQVRGPIQFGFARSIHPIITQEHAITRCAVTNDRDQEKERTMGRKFTVPYGLYRVHGFISAHLAQQTGFDAKDFDLLKEALNMMFESDRSAVRGEMTARRCIAFRHDSALGNSPAHKLFDRVSVDLVEQADQEARPPRSFKDYAVTVDSKDLPKGVKIEEWI